MHPDYEVFAGNGIDTRIKIAEKLRGIGFVVLKNWIPLKSVAEISEELETCCLSSSRVTDLLSRYVGSVKAVFNAQCVQVESVFITLSLLNLQNLLILCLQKGS